MTALDLIAFLAGEDNPKMWLHMDEGEMERLALTVKDQNLKLTLAFGIGKKHALKMYDQFALNTSCFWGSITPVVQFHEIFASTTIIN